jgi:methylmalonyl-CoA/ethylmalonyl-CoA epimerase
MMPEQESHPIMDVGVANKMRLSEPSVPVCQLRGIHHVGFVVNSIEEVADRFAKSIGAIWDHKTTHDPLQRVRVSFVGGGNSSFTSVELVEPAGPNSPVERFLQRGGGLHHLCYEVDRLEDQLSFSRSDGGVIVKPPLPAAAFEGRRIAWVVTKDKLLLEFLEGAS